MLNLNEKQDAINSIARVLRYGKTKSETEATKTTEKTSTEEIPEELPAA